MYAQHRALECKGKEKRNKFAKLYTDKLVIVTANVAPSFMFFLYVDELTQVPKSYVRTRINETRYFVKL